MRVRRYVRHLHGCKLLILGALCGSALLLVAVSHLRCSDSEALVKYDSTHRLIWIGGIPRSGTTLFKMMLDTHSLVHCGEETHVIPIILNIHNKMIQSNLEQKRLQRAKISDLTLNNALGSYILSIITGDRPSTSRYCNKDPFSLRHMMRLSKIFPNSKFILMIRDARATVHSIVSNNIKIKNFNTRTFRDAFYEWNRAMSLMYHQCLAVGPEKCLLVYYEQLVLHPRAEMERILSFLDLPWEERVLHHETFVGQDNVLSESSQIAQPINLGGLTKWMGHIPKPVLNDIEKVAPMFRILGYRSNTPEAGRELFYYGMPDVNIMQRHKKLTT